MRHGIAVTVALSALLWGAGCGSLNETFVHGVDASWSVIAPEYEAYVAADPALDAQTKALRTQTARGLTALIEEAKDESK